MKDMNQIEKTLESLRKNQMEAVYLESKNELPSFLSQQIQKGDIVTFGGSQTLYQTGVIDYLSDLEKEEQITFLNRDREGITREEQMEIYRQAFSSDLYLSSSNAITEDGFLYNVDGNGNRIAAITFGPKSVIIVAGYNKIVKNVEEAVKRVQQTAAPKNAVRLKIDTPCAKTGYCVHCQAENKICRDYLLHGKQLVKNRIKVVILGEEYGY